IERRATAVQRRAAVERPQALAVGVDLDADGRAPGAARRQLRPVLLQLVGIGIGVGIIGLGEYPFTRERGERDRACTQQQRSIACGLHVVSPPLWLLGPNGLAPGRPTNSIAPCDT